jgi:hypothetical protein
MDSLPVDGERLVGAWRLGRAEGSASAWRLSPESWWLEGVGRAGAGTSRTARLTWALDPLERTLSLGAATTVGWSSPFVLAGTVEAGGASAGDPSVDAQCEPWLASLETRYGAHPLQAVATLAPTDTLLSLGLLGLDELLAAGVVLPSGSGEPGPVESLGECVAAEPWNWGDPDHPWRACGSFLPLRGFRGDLRMAGGGGQGVLVVDGNLELSAGARFRGLVLVQGTLRVAGGAELVGMAVAVGGVSVEPGGRVRGSACWVVRSLAAQRATLGRFRLLPGVGSLGPF